MEVEAGYGQADLERNVENSGDLWNLSLFTNYWIDFPNRSIITPYVGFGLGGIRWEIDDVDHDTVFAWRLGAGLAFDVTNDISVSLDFRYLRSGEPTFDVNDLEFEPDINLYGFGVGLRYRF
jgi:opacity protein-like surface antigen